MGTSHVKNLHEGFIFIVLIGLFFEFFGDKPIKIAI